MFANPHSIVALKSGKNQMYISLNSILDGLQMAATESVLPPLPPEWRERVFDNTENSQDKGVRK